MNDEKKAILNGGNLIMWEKCDTKHLGVDGRILCMGLGFSSWSGLRVGVEVGVVDLSLKVHLSLSLSLLSMLVIGANARWRIYSSKTDTEFHQF